MSPKSPSIHTMNFKSHPFISPRNDFRKKIHQKSHKSKLFIEQVYCKILTFWCGWLETNILQLFRVYILVYQFIDRQIFICKYGKIFLSTIWFENFIWKKIFFFFIKLFDGIFVYWNSFGKKKYLEFLFRWDEELKAIWWILFVSRAAVSL